MHTFKQRQPRTLKRLAVILALSHFLLLSCDNTNKPGQQTSSVKESTVEEAALAEVNNKAQGALWEHVQLTLATILNEAYNLEQAGRTLLQKPSAIQLAELQQNWHALNLVLQSYKPFFDFAQANPERFVQLNQLHLHILDYPIQPGYLDSYGPYKYSGLVYEVGTALDPQSLKKLRQDNIEGEAITGIYPLHYVIFGEQGQRSHLEFERITSLSAADKSQGFGEVEELPQNRKRNLLNTLLQLLQQDLQNLQSHWKEVKNEQVNHTAQSKHLTPSREGIGQSLNRLFLEIDSFHEAEKEYTAELAQNKAPQNALLARLHSLELATRVLTQGTDEIHQGLARIREGLDDQPELSKEELSTVKTALSELLSHF